MKNLSVLKRGKWVNVLLVILISLVCFWMIKESFAAIKGPSDIVEEVGYELTPITLKEGDTLWSIQGELIPEDEDVRPFLHYIVDVNDFDISVHMVKAGETYLFLKPTKVIVQKGGK